jgi:hypothetical protein
VIDTLQQIEARVARFASAARAEEKTGSQRRRLRLRPARKKQLAGSGR